MIELKPITKNDYKEVKNLIANKNIIKNVIINADADTYINATLSINEILNASNNNKEKTRKLNKHHRNHKHKSQKKPLYPSMFYKILMQNGEAESRSTKLMGIIGYKIIENNKHNQQHDDLLPIYARMRTKPYHVLFFLNDDTIFNVALLKIVNIYSSRIDKPLYCIINSKYSSIMGVLNENSKHNKNMFLKNIEVNKNKYVEYIVSKHTAPYTYKIISPYLTKEIINHVFNNKYWRATNATDAIDFLYNDGVYIDKKYNATRVGIKNIINDAKFMIANKANLQIQMRNTKFGFKDIILHLNSINSANYDKYIPLSLFENGQVYIFKPVSGFSGKGIKVVDNREELIKYIEEIQKDIIRKDGKKKESNGKKSKPKTSAPLTFKFDKSYNVWVIQDYIKNPLLINGYKFHMRVFLLIYCNVNGKVEAYYSRKCPIANAREKYVYGDFNNVNIHDTHFRDADVSKYIFPDDIPDKSMVNKLHGDIVECLSFVFKNIANAVGCYSECKACYEIFGCDFMITDTYELKLLEINTKISLKVPGAGISIPFLKYLMKSIYSIVIDECFPSPNTHPDKDNLFTKLN